MKQYGNLLAFLKLSDALSGPLVGTGERQRILEGAYLRMQLHLHPASVMDLVDRMMTQEQGKEKPIDRTDNRTETPGNRTDPRTEIRQGQKAPAPDPRGKLGQPREPLRPEKATRSTPTGKVTTPPVP